jgi:hypothetical protein
MKSNWYQSIRLCLAIPLCTPLNFFSLWDLWNHLPLSVDTPFFFFSWELRGLHICSHPKFFWFSVQSVWPPLLSSCQSSWLLTHRSLVRFSALPDFLTSSRFGTGSTQPREHNWGATWNRSSGSGLERLRLTVVGFQPRWPQTSLYQQKLALNFTYQGRSLSWYSCLLTKSHGVQFPQYCPCSSKGRRLINILMKQNFQYFYISGLWMVCIKLPNPSGRTRPWSLLSL